MSDTLDTYRKQIDDIDDEILSLIAKRNRISSNIGRLKKENNIPIVDKKREEEKLLILSQKGVINNMSKKLIKLVWQAIFKESSEIQKGSALDPR